MIHSLKLFSIPLHWQAALWKILACLCFALTNGVVRYLTGGASVSAAVPLPAATIVFFQNFFGSLLLIPFVLQGYANPFKTSYLQLHILRVTFAVGGVVLWYLSLRYMPITQAVALNFSGPIFTVIAACLVLGEKIRLMRGIAVLASFIGSALILRPDKSLLIGGSALNLAMLLPLISALAIAVVKILSRKLARLGESPQALTTFLIIFMTPISFIIALIYGFAWPLVEHWSYLVLLGFLGTCAHLATSKAYVSGEVTFIMPFGISKILLSSAIGYWAFGEYPEVWTVWLGAAIIFLSVMLLSYQNYLDRKDKKWSSVVA